MTKSTTRPHLVIAGGGTGGHLFPGIAVADEFVRICPDARVTFVGTESGIEARVVPDLDHDLELVKVKPLKGGSALERAASLLSLPKSGWRSRRLLRRLEPDAVVSVGGYAAGPVTLMAALSGIPTAIMEQNSYPGLTNRLLSRVVDHGFLTFEDSAPHFGSLSTSVPGNPVRDELLAMAESFEYSPPEVGGPMRILIIGGSGGAGSFNRYIPDWLASMGDMTQRIHVRHQAGRDRSDEVIPRYSEFPGTAEVVEFIDDMAAAYKWCDLLICRAGATTIAEVLNLGIPAIYVPFPHAADDHQTANALSVVEAGAGVMIGDPELDSERSRNLLTGLMNNPTALSNLAAKSRTMARPDAGSKIAKYLKAMIE